MGRKYLGVTRSTYSIMQLLKKFAYHHGIFFSMKLFRSAKFQSTDSACVPQPSGNWLIGLDEEKISKDQKSMHVPNVHCELALESICVFLARLHWVEVEWKSISKVKTRHFTFVEINFKSYKHSFSDIKFSHSVAFELTWDESVTITRWKTI